jgi:hypothetical protein
VRWTPEREDDPDTPPDDEPEGWELECEPAVAPTLV